MTNPKIAAVAAKSAIALTLVGAVLTSVPAAYAQQGGRIYLEDQRGNEIGSGRIREDGRVTVDLDKGGELTGKMKPNGRMVLENDRGREFEFRCRGNGRCERDD